MSAIGTVWALGSWPDSIWADGSWAGAAVPTPVVVTTSVGSGAWIPLHQPRNPKRELKITKRDILRARRKRAKDVKAEREAITHVILPTPRPVVSIAPADTQPESAPLVEVPTPTRAVWDLPASDYAPQPFTAPEPYVPPSHWMQDDDTDALLYALAEI